MTLLKLVLALSTFMVTSCYVFCEAATGTPINPGIENIFVAKYKQEFPDLAPDFKDRLKAEVAKYDPKVLKEIRVYIWPDSSKTELLAEERIQCLEQFFKEDLKFERVRFYNMSNQKGVADAYKFGDKEKLKRLKLDPNTNYSQPENYSRALFEIII